MHVTRWAWKSRRKVSPDFEITFSHDNADCGLRTGNELRQFRHSKLDAACKQAAIKKINRKVPLPRLLLTFPNFMVPWRSAPPYLFTGVIPAVPLTKNSLQKRMTRHPKKNLEGFDRGTWEKFSWLYLYVPVSTPQCRQLSLPCILTLHVAPV